MRIMRMYKYGFSFGRKITKNLYFRFGSIFVLLDLFSAVDLHRQ